MRTLRNLLVATAILLGTSTTAPTFAQDARSPSAVQAANELISAISDNTVRDLTLRMTASAWPAIESTMLKMYPDLSAPVMVELRDEFERLQHRYLSQFVKVMPSLYARYLTADELRALAAFYRTPAGAKALQVMPSVSADLAAMMNPYLPRIQADVQQAMNDILRRRGYAQ